jgi:hypothetical protein
MNLVFARRFAAIVLLSTAACAGQEEEGETAAGEEAFTAGRVPVNVCSKVSGTNMSGTDLALQGLRRAELNQEVTPEEMKGLYWFSLYSGASRCPEALNELKKHMANDATIFQGAAATVSKQQYFTEAATGAFIAPGRQGGMSAVNYEDTRLREFYAGGKSYILLEGLSDLNLPLFGLKNAPMRFFSLWEKNNVDGRGIWQLKVHLSTLEEKAALQPDIDRVVAAMGGAAAPNVQLGAPFLTYKKDGVTFTLRPGSLTRPDGKIVDVLAETKADGTVTHADARTRQ